MKTSALALLAISVAVLSGCATTQYQNPYIKDPIALERQKAIDEGHCRRVSYGVVPMPQVRVYKPQQQNYTITGSVNSFDMASGKSTYSSYSANVRPSYSGGFAAGLAEGIINGMNMAAASAAQEAERKIYHGCMVSLGWVDVSSDAGKKQFEELASRQLKDHPTPINSDDWNLDYLQLMQSVEDWQLGSGDTYVYRVGEFYFPGKPRDRYVGLITENRYKSSICTDSNECMDQIIAFYAFDCIDKQYAHIGKFLFNDGKTVDVQTLNGKPEFQPLSREKMMHVAALHYCARDGS